MGRIEIQAGVAAKAKKTNRAYFIKQDELGLGGIKESPALRFSLLSDNNSFQNSHDTLDHRQTSLAMVVLSRCANELRQEVVAMQTFRQESIMRRAELDHLSRKNQEAMQYFLDKA